MRRIRLALLSRSIWLFVIAAAFRSVPAEEPTVPAPMASDAVKVEQSEPEDYAAELPRIAPLSPQEALQRFEVLPGFEIQLTAAEPLVQDPVAMSFDEDGRLFVIEMRDYSEQDKAMLGQVRLLEDRDGDGVYESSTVYASGLSWPTAILCYDGGIYVGAAPDIFFLKDTTGDGKADEKQVVFTGFGRSNVQGLMNCFRWGLDNRIHGATSSSGGTITRPDDPAFEPVPLRGRDFSFDPRTRDLRPESGGAQHGMCFDAWGRKFVCSNSSHAQQVVYDDRYVARNPLLAAPPARVEIADDGGQAPVYRSSPVEPWRIVRTRLRNSGKVKGPIEFGGQAAGYFTGATGITVYLGDVFPEPFRGMAFVADVGSNIIHRKQLTPNGIQLTASRIDENSEFLRSSDIWFRPVQMANGPDGCLHVLDMYREVIEHPASLPPEIKQHLDLTSGQDRGRLYRIAPQGHQVRRPAPLSQLPSLELVKLLAHPNGWHRETASRLLYERQDRDVIPALAAAVRQGHEPWQRLHALWTLQGLNALSAEIVAPALNDPHPRIREQALRLAEPFVDVPQIQRLAAGLANDDDPRVRFQLALSAGEFPQSWRVPVLVQLLLKADQDHWQQMAVFSSLPECAGDVLLRLLPQDEFRALRDHGAIIDQLAGQIARQRSAEEIAAVVERLRQFPGEPALQRRTIRALVSADPQLKSPTQGGPTGQLLESLLTEARSRLVSAEASLPERLEAVQTLGLSPLHDDAELLLEIITPAQPADLQAAALKSLSGFSKAATAEALLDRWHGMTPALRKQAEDLLLSRKSGTLAVLNRIEEGRLAVLDIDPARLRLLASHPDSQIKQRAAGLLSQLGNSTRDEVLERYQSALSLAGDADRGRTIFRKECIACHKLEEHGFEIGPNLATIQNRGKEAILLNILDPNREVNPQYLNYVVLLQDGRTQSGMIFSESATSLLLVRAENQSENLLRSEIEEMKSTGLSLMPEGLEKQIDPQGMADLLEYLLSLR